MPLSDPTNRTDGPDQRIEVLDDPVELPDADRIGALHPWAPLPLRIALVALCFGFGVLLLPFQSPSAWLHSTLLAAACLTAAAAATGSILVLFHLHRHGAGIEPIALTFAGFLAAVMAVPVATRGYQKIHRHVQRTHDYGPQFEKLAAFYDALNRFAVAHEGRWPDHVSELTGPSLPAETFLSPWRRPDRTPKPPSDAQGAVYRHGDLVFCYRGLGGASAPADSVLAFSAKLAPQERRLGLSGPARYDPDGRAVLFGDGQTRRISDHQFEQLLQKENRRRADRFGLPPIEPLAFDPDPDQDLMVRIMHLVYSPNA